MEFVKKGSLSVSGDGWYRQSERSDRESGILSNELEQIHIRSAFSGDDQGWGDFEKFLNRFWRF